MRTGWATIGAAVWLLAAGIAGAADSDAPTGLWKTIDDHTGAPRAIVRIFVQDGKYFGRIERSFRPDAETRVCSACSGDRKDKPILGLEIIRGMSRTDDGYAGGEILDPDSGSVYHCRFHLEDGGAKLVVRGYFGIPILGRSQTWLREP